MIADKILGNVKQLTTEKKQVKVPFEWFELEKKRLSKTAEDGTAIGVCIATLVKDGDVLGETEDSIYVASVTPSHLIKIQVDSMQEMGRLGFELGNRHLSLQITEQEVKVPFDEPTFAYLKKLGFKAEEVTEQFTDFVVCKAHGHSHGEEVAHSHAHDKAKKHLHRHSQKEEEYNEESEYKSEIQNLAPKNDVAVHKGKFHSSYYMF